MDPTANLEEQIRRAKRMQKCADNEHRERRRVQIEDEQPGCDGCDADGERLAELVLALDEWLRKGGALPAQWSRTTQTQTEAQARTEAEQLTYAVDAAMLGSEWRGAQYDLRMFTDILQAEVDKRRLPISILASSRRNSEAAINLMDGGAGLEAWQAACRSPSLVDCWNKVRRWTGGIHDTLGDNRPRRIVKLAASKTESAREWLTRDERGTWEKTAQELLDQSAPMIKKLKLTPEQVDNEIAIEIALLATTALLNDAKKRRAARR